MSVTAPTDSLAIEAKVETLFGCRVMIQDKEAFRKKLDILQLDGVHALNVITDFDFTLSTFRNPQGSRGLSCHKLLEDCGLLSDEYHEQAQAVQNYYYPLEVDVNIAHEERVGHMIDWAHKSHELLVKFGLTKDALQSAVDSAVKNSAMRLREKSLDFLDVCKAQGVPVLIFSAGIADVLEAVMAHFLSLEDHMPYIISNRCIFEGQQVKAFAEPVIHVFNKRSQDFLSTPFFTRTDRPARRNILLLGDSLGDVHMDDGWTELCGADSCVLKVGFLNDRVKERCEDYMKAFDIVILDDPGFDVPLGFLNQILGSKY